MRLKNKKAFVTAAGQGIGKAIVQKFIQFGSEVLATDINDALLMRLNASKSLCIDVRDFEAINRAIKDFEPDILINCAGIVHSGTILMSKDEEFDHAIDLNIKSMYHTIKAAIPIMQNKGGGSIINIGSVVSSVIGAPNRCIYGLSKAAVIGLTKSVAVDFVKEGIRCNCICPGTVDTPSLHKRLEETGDYDKAMNDFVNRQPMGRIGLADEIADLAAYLASDESKFVTGQEHIIDGGWSAS